MTRRRSAIALVFYAGAAALLLVAWNWTRFAAIPHMVSASPTPWDRLLVAWSAWSSTLLLLVPGLVLGVGLVAAGHTAGGWWVATGWSAALGAFVTFDLQIYAVYGRHLVELAEYFDEPTAGDYIGGFGIWVVRLLVCLACCAAVAAALAWLVRRGVAAAGDRLAGTVAVPVLALAAAALVDRSLPADARRGMIMANVGDVVPLSLAARRLSSNDDPVLEALQRRLEERFAVRAAALATPAPADSEATFRADRPPNVLVIIVEGLRYDAAARGLVPKLSRWGAQGLTLGRHYANANRTETALFALLYSRWPLTYHVTLDAAVRPQLTESLRRAGYRTHFLGTWQGGWLRMEEYLDERAFDEATSVGDGTADTRDHRMLVRAAELLQAEGEPRLVVVFLLSSHMPYVSPAAYGQLVPTPLGRGPLAERLWISYARSLAFLDDEIATLVERLDPTRNLIVVTGDHGESFDDDGKVSHGSRWSDAQCRALAYVVGPGIPRRTLHTATAHADLLPTVLHALAGRHVHIAHSSGRDLLDPPDAPDEAMLCQPRRDGEAGMALVRGDARLALDTDLVGRRVEVAGFRDDKGAPLPEHGTPLAAVSGWTASFDRALAGLAE